ncbi:hypothetical protein DPMN_171326 [Dreissena polymorpha]|uniref:Uncharacterized protein n=1 Tax=Dreissena polymorpha TaxID=45954 RepID=A0A9D4IF23_DREPO|nr:hypothetical protein DPMN_171326 [Dreissena polymorpha]
MVVYSYKGCPFATLDTTRLDKCMYSNGITDVTFTDNSADHATICTYRRCNVMLAIECTDGRWVNSDEGGSESAISDECRDTQ